MRDIYENQKQFFQKIINIEYQNELDISSRVKDYCIGIQKNAVDVLNSLDWDVSKEPKSNSSLHQKIETVDAAIDIIKYSYNLCLEHDINYEELIELLKRKNRTVEQKFNQRQFLKGDKFKKAGFAFIFDIDGVLADISTALVDWFDKKIKDKNFKSFDELMSWRIHNIDEWKAVKEEYRLSGYKMNIPAVKGAKELLKLCHNRGIVSLLSNRPVKQYPILYQYTVEWLYNKNLIQHVDMLHFTDLGEKKYFFDRFLGKEVYFIEDNVYNLININERPNVCNLFFRNETNKHVESDSFTNSDYYAAEFFDLEEVRRFIINITD